MTQQDSVAPPGSGGRGGSVPLCHDCRRRDKDGGKITTVVATPGQGPDRSQEVSYTDTKVIGNGSFGVVYQAKLCHSGEMLTERADCEAEREYQRKSDSQIIQFKCQSLNVTVSSGSVGLVSLGQTVSLLCQVTADNLALLALGITWLRDGRHVIAAMDRNGVVAPTAVDSGEVGLERTGASQYRLVLSGVSGRDSGAYTCRVRAFIERTPGGSGGGSWYQAAEKTSDPVTVRVAQISEYSVKQEDEEGGGGGGGGGGVVFRDLCLSQSSGTGPQPGSRYCSPNLSPVSLTERWSAGYLTAPITLSDALFKSAIKTGSNTFGSTTSGCFKSRSRWKFHLTTPVKPWAWNKLVDTWLPVTQWAW
ncbi:hypothetical protein CRUP_010286 [Coryphaenoides rupestris]|nr:hypothetical protein CRUP_010286 [Coryphaenoides rupestris]